MFVPGRAYNSNDFWEPYYASGLAPSQPGTIQSSNMSPEQHAFSCQGRKVPKPVPRPNSLHMSGTSVGCRRPKSLELPTCQLYQPLALVMLRTKYAERISSLLSRCTRRSGDHCGHCWILSDHAVDTARPLLQYSHRMVPIWILPEPFSLGRSGLKKS
ncbi:hypothetical protein M404DRAFT_594949 [Pisolithus tinctorius Marx 270]|uniref:Uncharacterized protein n=1 Tax=Pisolithus tinctorius Marx 270 TaxID=870435 RepID=A0A0C3PI39_PISTI|nr:hypothetical protein M404DRAFT_594949 [Pisolithus tinctorius Marx 270]